MIHFRVYIRESDKCGDGAHWIDYDGRDDPDEEAELVGEPVVPLDAALNLTLSVGLQQVVTIH